MSQTLSPVGKPVIEQVLLCDIFSRQQNGKHSISSSLPGHLIQLVICGRTFHEVNGRQYEFSRGDLIWYHEDEMVQVYTKEVPWEYYTLNFIASSLSPPSFEQRVQRVGQPVFKKFDQLLRVWRQTDCSSVIREMQVQAKLLELLSSLSQGQPVAYAMSLDAEIWWTLETQLRQQLDGPINLPVMEQLAQCSQATIARSCHAAVGMSPMKRIKQIRMSLARGLVVRSSLNFTQISEQIGYSRIHEFSRDFKKYFNQSPTQCRHNT